jgi:hypothetical protein
MLFGLILPVPVEAADGYTIESRAPAEFAVCARRADEPQDDDTWLLGAEAWVPQENWSRSTAVSTLAK